MFCPEVANKKEAQGKDINDALQYQQVKYQHNNFKKQLKNQEIPIKLNLSYLTALNRKINQSTKT